MAFNPNALSDADYYAMQQSQMAAPPVYLDNSGQPVLDLENLVNLAQVVAYGGGFDPNSVSDADYYAIQQRYLNPGETAQYYNFSARRPARKRVPPLAPEPESAPQFNPIPGTQYGPQMFGPIMIQPPAGWAPMSYAPYNPYYYG